MSKIVDINSQPVSTVVVADDKYNTLHDVLLDGKTVQELTDAQLVYLVANITAQHEAQVLLPVWVARLTGKTDRVPNENDKTPDPT